VDTHAHVIGPNLIAGRSYTPTTLATPEAYVAMLDGTGMAHGVLIQVSVHGSDNSLMLQTLKEHPQRLRGIAVTSHEASEAELRMLKEGGVVGLRLNATTGGGVGLSQLDRYEAICVELGWHLQFLVHGDMLPTLAPRLAKLRVPAVLDHMGYVSSGQPAEAQTLVQMVRDGVWVKLSGGFRISRERPPYADTIPLARALADAAPDRCVWGSDWPHVNFRGTMPNTGDLLDLLADWVPDAARRDAILATNAHRLYGFKR
jgi:predicted TIM-barrel fold metal-dependent hydrolase